MPRLSTLVRLANYYGVDVSALLSDGSNSTREKGGYPKPWAPLFTVLELKPPEISKVKKLIRDDSGEDSSMFHSKGGRKTSDDEDEANEETLLCAAGSVEVTACVETSNVILLFTSDFR